MENSGAPGHTTDCIYEDMTSTSPLTDEGYMTSSGSNSSRFRFSSAGRSAAVRPIPLSVYMNMDGKSRDQEATLVPDTSARGLSRETSRDEDATLRPPCYEYIDIELPDRGLLSPVAPPCLPSRNKKPSKPDIYTTSTPQEATRNPSGESRDKQLSEGLKSYQEQSRLQKEVMMNFSASVLESNSRNDSCHSRAFMNSAV